MPKLAPICFIPFVAPFPTRRTSKTRFGIVSMGGTEEGIKTTMEVDSIATRMATKST